MGSKWQLATPGRPKLARGWVACEENICGGWWCGLGVEKLAGAENFLSGTMNLDKNTFKVVWSRFTTAAWKTNFKGCFPVLKKKFCGGN